MNDQMTMTITIPADDANGFVALDLRFPKARLARVCQMVELLTNVSDAMIAAEMGEWQIG